MDFEIYLFMLEPFNSKHFDASFKPLVQDCSRLQIFDTEKSNWIQRSNLFLFVVVFIIVYMVYILSYTEFPVIFESKLLFSNQIVI